jgi:YidC/Oxa1 family membrane protein insertase
LFQDADEAAAASQQIVQFLPIMFGFFALNVPSGLGVYWIVNGLFSTGTTLLIKKQVSLNVAILFLVASW